jgi:5-methylcytosine-specific restriction endonuclease McrA
LQEKKDYNVDAFARLSKVGDQRKFWSEEMPKLKSDYGLIFKDRKRRFSVEQRLSAWLRQDGKCGKCDKKIPSTVDAHHIVNHHLGGSTTDGNNCLLIHKKCHQEVTIKTKQSAML